MLTFAAFIAALLGALLLYASTKPDVCHIARSIHICAPRAGGSDVTWAMSGRQPFLGKVMSLFINTEKMVGGAFESGLAELKAKAEG